MKRLILLCVCLCLIAALTPAASAESYSGSVDSSPYGDYTNYEGSHFGYAAGTNSLKNLTIGNIENSGGLQSWILFARNAPGSINSLGWGMTIGTNVSAQTPFTAHIGNTYVGSGDCGFQRVFNPAGTELPGYFWVVFNDWDAGALTGTKLLNLSYDENALWQVNYGGYQTAGTLPSKTFINNGVNAVHTISTLYDFHNTYALNSPEGLGISGTITKNVTGTLYSSKVYFVNNTGGQILSSDKTYNSLQFNFSYPIIPSVQLAILDIQGNWHNNTFTFTNTDPTPTPTPTPTAVPTTPIGPQNPIPAGYVRSMAECVDGQTSGRMHDCVISLKDVENATWSNSTWEWGYWWIDTLPTHTIDAYGVLSGYASVVRTGQPASGTRMIELVMWPEDIPAAATGKVNLFVIVNDYESSNAITGAAVSIRDSATGITTSHTTGHSGTVQTTATNATMMYITVSKYGYDTRTVPFETSDFGPDTKRVELFKSVVTTVPTATIPPGGVTTAVTVDPAGTPDPAGGASGYSTAKGQQMMDYLAMNGMDLVQLCVMVTILGLLGFKLGGR
jgi:hypothetical protein